MRKDIKISWVLTKFFVNFLKELTKTVLSAGPEFCIAFVRIITTPLVKYIFIHIWFLVCCVAFVLLPSVITYFDARIKISFHRPWSSSSFSASGSLLQHTLVARLALVWSQLEGLQPILSVTKVRDQRVKNEQESRAPRLKNQFRMWYTKHAAGRKELRCYHINCKSNQCYKTYIRLLWVAIIDDYVLLFMHDWCQL